jgi:glycosyltransferase involved in cell wall biosynthesis
MRQQGFPVSFLTPVIRKEAFGLGIRQTTPLPFRILPWRCQRRLCFRNYTKAVLRAARPGVVLDFWSDHPSPLLAEAKRRGATILKEKFNCAQAVARDILSAEYARLGLANRCKITEASIQREWDQLTIADLINSPSPLVTDSLIHIQVAPKKIIDTSFGWEPRPTTREQPSLVAMCKRPRFLFVGSVEVRKGAHLLLEYWKAARIDGTLVFMGAVREEMRSIIERLQPGPTVVFLGHREKAHQIYDEVDVFTFPSLEEGSPLVTYEAMGRGLPVLLSPMGAGGIARTNFDGFVVPPHDRSEWIQALTRLAADPPLRRQFGATAAARATKFLWEKTAAQRYASLATKLGEV